MAKASAPDPLDPPSMGGDERFLAHVRHADRRQIRASGLPWKLFPKSGADRGRKAPGVTPTVTPTMPLKVEWLIINSLWAYAFLPGKGGLSG